MRKLIFATNFSVDACCDHTKGIPDAELHGHYARELREAGVLLYGRKTYELMVPFWPEMAQSHSAPDQDINDFADAFAAKPIVVVSRTLKDAGWKNARVASGDLKETVLQLKREPGGPIMTGGVDIPNQLIQLGLVDEFRFIIQPQIVGAGRRIMEGVEMPEAQKVELAGTETFASGSILLRYVRRA
jgi:dihydrofolate reductase